MKRKGYRKLLSVMLICSMLVAMPSSEALAADFAVGYENTGADAAEAPAETEENVVESDIGAKEQEESETEDLASERDGGEKETGETVSENNGSEDAGERTEGTETEDPQEEAVGVEKETADFADTLPEEKSQGEQAEDVTATAVAEGGETSGSCGANLTWRFEDGVLTISGSGAMTTVIDGNIRVPWSNNCDKINKVVIQNGVTSIDGFAFRFCYSLTGITIPDSVTSIGKYAFQGCTSLTGITIPDSVTSIGNHAFDGCTSLTGITIPNSVTSIGDYAFDGCRNLTKIMIPDSVTSIGGGAFYDCTSLTGITIPGSVTSIGGSAFYGCTSLTGITIPDSVTDIGGYAFCGCTSLTGITIPDSVTFIGECAFFECTSLTGITIPDGVTRIYGGTFALCKSLTEITIPSSVTKIEDGVRGKYNVYSQCGAFDDCTSLKKITIPNSVTYIGSYAFAGCGLQEITIPDSVRVIGDGAFRYCSSLTGITISDSVTRIGIFAFQNCTSLKEMTIPNSVTSIGKGTFAKCTSLTEITIPLSVTSIDGPTYRDGDAKLFTADDEPACGAFYGCSSLLGIKIPGSIKTIGRYAFCMCSELNEITIPSSVTAICDGTFRGCRSLTGITIPDSVTVIGVNAFQNCASLTGITVPNGVTVIGDYAFDGCTSLTDVYYGRTEDDWKSISIGSHNEPLLSANIHYNSLSGTAGDNLGWILDMNGVLTISGTGKMADYHEPDAPAPWSGQRDQIKTIVISQGVTSIGASAFSGCTNLTEITIPKSVVSIGDSAFSGCGNLARVRFLGSKEQLESIIVGTDNEPYYKASRSWIEGGSDSPDNSDFTLAVTRRSFAFTDPQTVQLNWGWNYILNRNSTEYIHDVSTVALALSAATERSQDAIESMLAGEHFGADFITSKNYNTDTIEEINNPACTFAHKAVNNGGKTEHIIIIVGRGTSTDADLITDAISLGDHFSEPASNVWRSFLGWLNTSGLADVINGSNTKFFVTGHSLGGAVANRIAYRLTQDYGRGSVYAYTFGTPPTEGHTSTYAPNIFNVLYYWDPVPFAGVFTDGRYGMECWFTDDDRGRFLSKHYVQSYMKRLLNGADQHFKGSRKSGGAWCPVDLKIYNSSGDLVGSVTDNAVDQENVTDSVLIVLSGENKDQKNFYFFDDDTYDIELVGKDNGTLTYTIRDTSADKQTITERIYSNVALTPGKRMTSSVSVWDKTNPDISVEDKIDTPQVQLLVLDENDNIIREVLPDGAGTEIPYTGSNEVLPGDIPADGKIPDGLWIAGVEDSYIYTGAAIEPEIRVYDGKKKLQPGKDYTASYKNNTKANDAANPSAAPAVVVKGKGNYAGTETAAFKITPVALEDSSVAAEDITVAYNKKVQKKVPIVTYNGRKLAKNKDFTVSYPNAEPGAYKEVGTYDILLTAKKGGNFSGTKTVRCIIADSVLLGQVNVKKIPNQTYTGKAIEPELTVTYKNTPLIKGTDYLVSYTDHTEIGTAKAVLTGIGKYAGTKSASFKITGTSLKGAVLSGIVNQTYNGSYQRQDMTVALNGSTLKEGTDYEVSYTNNKDVGKASVTIKGKGAYAGTVKKTFQIGKFDIAANMDGRFTAEVKQEIVPYAKGGAKPTVVVRFRMGDGRWQTLTEGRDYTLSYRNHTAVNDGSRAERRPAVTVKGKGSFRGTYGTVLGYKIMAQDIGQLTLKAQDKTYRNQKNVFATKVTVTDLDGKVLKAGTDYNKTAAYTYVKETAVKTAGRGTAVRVAGDAVDKNDIIPAGTVLKVQVQAKAGGNYTGVLAGEYRITQAAISSASVSVPKQIYTGQPITLEKSLLTVKMKGKRLDASQYEIVPGSYKNNVEKGTASVTIRGVDNYGGTKTVKFTIRAKGFLWWWR